MKRYIAITGLSTAATESLTKSGKNPVHIKVEDLFGSASFSMNLLLQQLNEAVELTADPNNEYALAIELSYTPNHKNIEEFFKKLPEILKLFVHFNSVCMDLPNHGYCKFQEEQFASMPEGFNTPSISTYGFYAKKNDLGNNTMPPMSRLAL